MSKATKTSKATKPSEANKSSEAIRAATPSSASPHRLVMASAGTGKTFRLTGEYLRYALRECDREQGGERGDLASILATTFTRKAAAEILERVLDRLSAAALDPAKLTDLQKEVDPSLTPARCSMLLGAVLRNLERLSIETIDAYFMRMAQMFALELGIPPGWRIVEQQEDEDLREEALDAVLDDGDREKVLSQLKQLMGGDLGRSVRESLLRSINGVYGAYQAGDGREEIWRTIGPQTEPLTAGPLAAAIAALESTPLPMTKAGQPNKNWANASDAAVRHAGQSDWESFLRAGIAAKLIDPEVLEPVFSRLPIELPVESRYRPLIEHAKAVILGAFRDQNVAGYRFAASFDAAYWKLKATRGLYRFEDVPIVLLRAALQDKLEEIYFRMDATIRHVLLDEFQDTSLVQFQLLEPLLDEMLSADDGRSVFCVGDIKQSLYSWRGAEPSLMPAMPDRWGSLVQETLEKSYRSSEVITATVNAVFDGLPANAAVAERIPIAKEWSKAFKPHTTARKLMGAATLTVAPVDAEGVAQPMAFAASRVKVIVDASPTATVGVLVRTNKHIPTLIYELKKLGIEASEEGGSPLMDAAPVAVTVSLLQLADFPGDSAAAFHVATSPLGRVLDLWTPVSPLRAREVSSMIRARLMAEGYGGVVRWVLEVCDGQIDSRGFARLNQLVDLAQEFDEHAGTRPAEFVRLARDAHVEDPSRSRVRVMSIHKSKGLEFDAVVLPDLDKAWALNKNSFLIDRDGPLGPVTAATRYPNTQLRQFHAGLNEIYERNLDKSVREELSCLYVAMTRAVHSLEMIVLPSDKADVPLSAAGVLRAALGGDQLATAGAELWRSDRFDEWAGDVQRKVVSESAEGGQLLELKVKPGSGSFVPRRHRASPSSLEPSARRVDGLFSTRGERAKNEGTLLHAWFELVEWLDDAEPSDEELLAVAEGLGWDAEDAGSLLAVFKGSLSGSTATALKRDRYKIRPRADRVDVRREWAFEVRLPPVAGREPIDLVGRFDRLVIGFLGNKPVWADVVDFKSDNVAGDDAESLAMSVANYQPQLAAYMRGVCEMFSLRPADVTASLLFVRPRVVRELDSLK